MTSSSRSSCVVASPVGPLTLVATATALLELRFADEPVHDDTTVVAPTDHQILAATADQLAAYFAGQRQRFELPIELHGTAFQRRVWSALRTIPYGETWSYGRIAAAIGAPTASRAVGLANGRNPVSIIVPCHRVIGADGRLTGYGGGLDRKRLLLDLEAGVVGTPTTR